jgi:2-methylcitrate dehydratase PrpD
MILPDPTKSADCELTNTRQLARFVCQSDWSSLPNAVQHEAVRSFVNWVGCAFGGSSHPAVDSASKALSELSDTGQCSVLGRGLRLDPLNAALLNGLSASAYAFDDTHLETVAHPTAPTVAALLAYAERHQVCGRDFLHSLIISNEVQCRLSRALVVSPATSHLGLYMTGLTGAAGVAAGVGKLLGLSEQQMAWAIGIGAMQGAGFRASHGNMCGGFVPANAGRNGMLAAQLAANAFTCHDDALAAANGFLDVYANRPNLHALTDCLGEHYECMNVVAKPFPAGIFTHPAIDACLRLVHAHVFDSDETERVDVAVHNLALGLTGKKEPQHAYDAQVSVYHWIAAVLCHRRASLHEASDACVLDERVVAMRKRVIITADNETLADEARISVTLRDGRRLESAVSPCVGSKRLPMTDEQISVKFISQTTDQLGLERATRLLAYCWQLSKAGDVKQAAPGFWG